MAYQSNLLGDFWQSYRQKKLGGGRVSRREAGNLLGPMLEYDAQKAAEAGRRELEAARFNREMSLRERAQKSQDLSAMVGGVGQLATLPLAYKAGKDIGWWGGDTYAGGAMNAGKSAINAATGKTMTNTVSSTSPNLLGGPVTAQGAIAPAAVGSTTAQGAATGSAIESAAAGAGGAPEAATFAGAEGAGAGGLLSTVAPYLPPVAAGLAGGQFGSRLAMKYSPFGGEREKNIGGGIAGGAAAGAAAGAFGGPASPITVPIGAGIGAVIGGVSSLF